MDTFRDVSSDEARYYALQFMGQHLTGDLKELNRNIISQNQTLQGMTLDPVKVINTIPSPVKNTVNAGISIQRSIPQNSLPLEEAPITNDPNQLEFIFKQTDLDTIFNKLERIDNKISKLISILDKSD
jgi:hypothetical protein